MFGGALVYFSNFAGLVPKNFFTTHAVMWGNLFEMLIVSLGLAYKISTLDREKKEAFIMAKGKREYERLVRVLLHDIGNPVSLIKHYTLMRERNRERFQEKEEKAWEKISFGVTKIDEIIKFHRQQELNLSKNFRELHIDSVNLKLALEQVQEMFEETLEAKGLELSVNVNQELDVKAEQVSLINEVLNNIVSNAIKFSFEGGVISVTAFEEVGLIYVKITDQGRGILEQNLKSFMEDKGIVSTTGTKGEQGTGYGLYLVKSYMDLYGGQVLVQSTSIEKDARSHGTEVTLIFEKAD
jgi:adenylate cyclase